MCDELTVMGVGSCYLCKKPFGFNPKKVPSFQDTPICEACVKIINEKRKENGFEPITYSKDAYEPTSASGL